MSKLERLNDRVAKLLTMAVHDVLGVVKETVLEYQEKTARTQRENESLKRRLRELQGPHLSICDKTIKDEIEEVDPETGSSPEGKFSMTLQKEMREEEMIFITDSNTADCSVSPGLVTEHLSNVTNTDLTVHVAYWLPGEEHNPDMADTVQYSDQWKQELDPANQNAASFPFLGSIGAVSCETPVRRNSLRLRLKKQRSKSEPFIQNYTDEEEPLDWEGSERQIGPTSNEPAELEPSEPEWRSLQRVVGRPKLYCCSLCGRAFRHANDYKKHHRVHTGEKPYSCSVCGNHFSQSSGLKVHQRQHTGEKPYGCTQCSKRFSRSDHLKIHQRQHTGEKPYSCTQCDKRFSYSSDCKRHQLNHH